MKHIKHVTILILILISTSIYAAQKSDYFSRAIEAEKSGKFSVAIKWFRKALNITNDPGLKTKILLHMGDCYYAINNQIAAIDLYEEALKNPEAEKYLITHPNTYINLANIYFNQGDYDKAANIYLKIIKKYRNKPFIPFILIKAGDSLLNLKQFKEALKAYSKVILIYKDSEEYWIARFRMADIGILHPNLKVPNLIEYRDYRNPLNAYKQISENAPDNMFKLRLLARLRIASVYLKEKRYPEAINLIRFVMKHNMDSTLREYAKGLLIKTTSQFINILHKKKDYLRICKLYKSIKAEIPLSKFDNVIKEKIADALYRLEIYKDALDIYLLDPKKNIKKIASIYNQLGRYKETINLLAPLKGKTDPELDLILARALYKEKRFKDVINLLTPKIDKISAPEAYYLLATSYEQINNKKKAIYYYKILSKKDSEYRLNAYLSLGNLLFDIKKYKDAISYYILAQKLCNNKCPDSDFIKLQIASCYYQMGDYKKSTNILKKMKGKGLIRLVSNLQLEIIQLENTYKELKWLIE